MEKGFRVRNSGVACSVKFSLCLGINRNNAPSIQQHSSLQLTVAGRKPGPALAEASCFRAFPAFHFVASRPPPAYHSPRRSPPPFPFTNFRATARHPLPFSSPVPVGRLPFSPPFRFLYRDLVPNVTELVPNQLLSLAQFTRNLEHARHGPARRPRVLFPLRAVSSSTQQKVGTWGSRFGSERRFFFDSHLALGTSGTPQALGGIIAGVIL